ATDASVRLRRRSDALTAMPRTAMSPMMTSTTTAPPLPMAPVDGAPGDGEPGVCAQESGGRISRAAVAASIVTCTRPAQASSMLVALLIVLVPVSFDECRRIASALDLNPRPGREHRPCRLRLVTQVLD